MAPASFASGRRRRRLLRKPWYSADGRPCI